MNNKSSVNYLLICTQDAHSSGGEEVDETHSIPEDTASYSPLPLGASVLGEGVEGEDVEGMDEEDGDDDVLDFEYEFDDDDEVSDYDISWREFPQMIACFRNLVHRN